MTVSDSLRAKVRAELLHPSADGLEQALEQLLAIQARLPGAMRPSDAPSVLRELSGISRLARQAQQFYSGLISAGAPRDEADANYTAHGRMLAHAPDLHPAIPQVLHG